MLLLHPCPCRDNCSGAVASGNELFCWFCALDLWVFSDLCRCWQTRMWVGNSNRFDGRYSRPHFTPWIKRSANHLDMSSFDICFHRDKLILSTLTDERINCSGSVSCGIWKTCPNWAPKYYRTRPYIFVVYEANNRCIRLGSRECPAVHPWHVNCPNTQYSQLGDNTVALDGNPLDIPATQWTTQWTRAS